MLPALEVGVDDVVDRVHEDPAEQADHRDVVALDPDRHGTATRQLRREVERAQHPEVLVGQDLVDVGLSPDVVAGGDDVDAGVAQLAGGAAADALAAGAVLAVDDDEGAGQFRAPGRQESGQRPPAGRPDRVADQEDADKCRVPSAECRDGC